MFLRLTWPDFMFTFVTWCLSLIVWTSFEPSFAKDVAEFNTEAAVLYRRASESARPKIRNLWLFGGSLGTVAYALTIVYWPHPNWALGTVVPLLRTLAEFVLGAAFGQAADLMLRGGPIVGGLIRRQDLERRLGVWGPPVTFTLRNVNAVFALLMTIFVLIVGYEGEPTQMVVNVAAALAASRYLGSISGELDHVEALIAGCAT